MKTLMLIVFVLVGLNGCATIYTVTTDPVMLQKEACGRGCTIPRIYSGSALDICSIIEDETGQGGAIMVWDMFFSIPADTIILPYTIFMQVKEGSFSSSEICSSMTRTQPTKKTGRIIKPLN